MNRLKDLELQGKRVLVRVDFNVPVEDGHITDDTRIHGALPTIKHIIQAGGTAVLMSHFGRPKGEFSERYSLRVVAQHLETLLDTSVKFCAVTVGERAEKMVAAAAHGSVIVLENTRFLAGETKNDAEVGAAMAHLADVFIMDAFGSAHRAHASTAAVVDAMREKKGQVGMGLLLEAEVDFLTKALEKPERPFVAVLGGAKVSDKIGVIEALLPKVDHLLVGGAMAYTLLSARGAEVGASRVEDDRIESSAGLLDTAGDKIVLPTDHVVADRFAANANTRTVEGDIPEGWMGLDIGPNTRKRFEQIIGTARTVIWNGPMGVFEMPAFSRGTRSVARALAEATRERGAMTIVGGGDSVAAIQESGLAEAVSHVSTGGGAMLEFLEGKTLPGIAALAEPD
ncbi:hypothetical protein BH23BAC4_BH23BAC4_17700 [soil metagenome]